MIHVSVLCSSEIAFGEVNDFVGWGDSVVLMLNE